MTLTSRSIAAHAPQLLTALRHLLAVAPVNVVEDAKLLAAVMAGNQAVSDAIGQHRCDQCCGTRFMRLLGSTRFTACSRCEHA